MGYRLDDLDHIIKPDLAQAIDAFRPRLWDQLDRGTLTGELLAVVEGAMQPPQASLRLRPQGPPSAETNSAVGPLAAVE